MYTQDSGSLPFLHRVPVGRPVTVGSALVSRLKSERDVEESRLLGGFRHGVESSPRPSETGGRPSGLPRQERTTRDSPFFGPTLTFGFVKNRLRGYGSPRPDHTGATPVERRIRDGVGCRSRDRVDGPSPSVTPLVGVRPSSP